MIDGAGKIKFGIYACSPEDSSFKAVFTDMKLTECQWKSPMVKSPDEMLADCVFDIKTNMKIKLKFSGCVTEKK